MVKDYSEFNTNDDYSAGLTKLNTEIMSGVIPDMFLTENLPIRRYAAKGIPDRPLRADRQRRRADARASSPDHQACETDGKLYELPASFMVQTAFGLSKVVDGYDVWNVAALQDAMTKLQEDAYVFDYYTTRPTVMGTCDSNNPPRSSTGRPASASFDSESFITLLNL